MRLLLVLLVVSGAVHATECLQVLNRGEWLAACDSTRANCAANPTRWKCQTGTCTAGPQTLPACGLSQWNGPYVWRGFNGQCPAVGSDGPTIQTANAGLGEGEIVCYDGCSLTDGPDQDYCTEMQINGAVERLCVNDTVYAEGACIPGSGDPGQPGGPDPSPDPEPSQDDDPRLCDAGTCVSPGNTTSGDPGGGPNICMSVDGGPTVCRPVPPPPATPPPGCSVGQGGAVCTGNPPPYPPSPPYPSSPPQTPEVSGQSGPPGGPMTPFTGYGPPGPGQTCPPEQPSCVADGYCPSGMTQAADPDCPADGEEGGTCGGEGQPECGDNRTAGLGDCYGPPACAGDAIDCSVVRQTWETRCALRGTLAPPPIDLAGDPLRPYGGAGGMFVESGGEDGGLSGLNTSGFLASSCPEPPSLGSFRGQALTMPAIWCDYGWLGSLTIAVAMFIAARVLFGGSE